ncbi:MAG: hypothetical protein HXS48_13760 [Theionarchaea archaeon]|nr:hypothetical protein [Theionarchaea archaeon]
MKGDNLKEHLWKAGYLILLAVILSYCWVSFRMEVLSPVSFGFPFVVLAAAVCGALVYLFIGEVRRAFYACIVMCAVGCVITALFFYLPSFQGLLPEQMGALRSLDSVLMAIFVIPFSAAGSFVAAYLFPE